MLKLPQRNLKPRKNGITAIHDVRLTRGELKNILDDHAGFVDIAKLGVGSAYVTPNLTEKIRMYKDAQIRVYFGGTLFEKFYHQKALDNYKKFMNDHKVDMLEISCGTIDIPIDERLELVENFRKDFNVLSEVGSKDGDAIMAPSIWIKELDLLINAGCEYVITEGRNSGTAGVYRKDGEMRTGLIDDIIRSIDVEKIIFEAPMPKAQMTFIKSVGANVNLGNVNPYDLLLLEAQRHGLRSETFFIK